ncbi:MAG: hypothetical protein NT080_01065 [Spirochaetes bacterium]|nr:hypothetical protein [Spirochaetota bacterium]
MKFTIYSDAGSLQIRKFVARLGSDVDLLPSRSLGRTIKRVSGESFPYIDAAGFGECALRRKVSEFSDRDISVGIIDPGGDITDPASLFFAGAMDYIGPALLKAGVDIARLEDAAVRAGAATDDEETGFPGWKKLVEGREYRFMFCYAAICDQSGLRERIGEKRLAALKDAYASYMANVFMEANGLLWMKDQTGILLIFPEDVAGEPPIKLAFELLMNRAIVGYEVFHLEVPVGFKFVFHTGSTVWRHPGSTGSIVSEDVNFIHHLALRHAGDNRITVSSECEDAIPAPIDDLFSPGAKFEGHRSFSSIVFI